MDWESGFQLRLSEFGVYGALPSGTCFLLAVGDGVRVVLLMDLARQWSAEQEHPLCGKTGMC